MSRRIFLIVTLTITVISFTGCFGGGGSGGAGAENFNSLSNLPNFDEVIASGGLGSSGLFTQGVVNGTPLPLKDLDGNELATYFTGSVDSIITTIQDPGSTFEEVNDALNNFFTGMAKCQIAQGAAEQLQHLNESTTSICYMSKLPKQPGIEGSLQHVSGDVISDLSTLMDQSTATRTLKMNITAPSGDPENPEVFYIYFTFTGSDELPNNYRAKLDFCEQEMGSWENDGSELIDLNRSTGTLVLTHLGQDDYSDGSGAFNSTFTAQVRELANGEYEWYGDRIMTVQGAFSGSFSVSESETYTFSDAFNGSLTASNVDGNTLISSKLFHKSNMDNGTIAFDSQGKGFAKVIGVGSSFSDFAVLMGAGRHIWQHDLDTHEASIGFEYDENLTPRYNTTNLSFVQNITVDDLYSDVVSLDFSTDPLLGQSQPIAPDVNQLVFDCANPPAATSEYNFDMSTLAALAVSNDCEQHFHGGRNLCQKLYQYEEEIFQELNQQ